MSKKNTWIILIVVIFVVSNAIIFIIWRVYTIKTEPTKIIDEPPKFIRYSQEEIQDQPLKPKKQIFTEHGIASLKISSGHSKIEKPEKTTIRLFHQLNIPKSSKLFSLLPETIQIDKNFYDEKNWVFLAAFSHEMSNLCEMNKNNTMEKNFGNIELKKLNEKIQPQILRFVEDSSYELLNLLKRYKTIVANTVADSVTIGGNFGDTKIINDKYYKQEETMMILLSGLFESLVNFEEKRIKEPNLINKENLFAYQKVSNDKGLKNAILKDYILFSSNLKLRIPMKYFDEYEKLKTENLQCKFENFIDFLTKKKTEFENGTLFEISNEHEIKMFTISWDYLDECPDKKDDSFYNLVKKTTEKQITVMLNCARATGVKCVLITIPKSDECIKTEFDPKKESRLNAIIGAKIGAGLAINKNGNGFDEIVICGMSLDFWNRYVSSKKFYS